MLVITRRLDEIITIGDQIKIMVVSVKGKSVRIGIECPKTIPVHRGEVFKEIMDEEKKNRLPLDG